MHSCFICVQAIYGSVPSRSCLTNDELPFTEFDISQLATKLAYYFLQVGALTLSLISGAPKY